VSFLRHIKNVQNLQYPGNIGSVVVTIEQTTSLGIFGMTNIALG
jgi:hypothetical protein